MRGCSALLWDSVLSYSTTRTVKLKDWRLGTFMLLVNCTIVGYVLIAQVLIRQAYLLPGRIVGSVDAVLTEPSQEYYYGKIFTPAICVSSLNTSDDPRFTYPVPGYYQYTGDGSNSNPLGPLLPCSFLDGNFLIPDSQSTTVFVPTYIQKTQQYLPEPLASLCKDMQLVNCSRGFVSAGPTLQSYVPVVDMFYLTITHSFESSGGIRGDGQSLNGELLAANNAPMDPCIVYDTAIYPLGCPPLVRAFGTGGSDTLPVRALLVAAGLASLDEGAGASLPLSNTTRRLAGVVLQLEIHYYNYMLSQPSSFLFRGTGSMDPSVVRYYYKVTVLPTAQAQQTQTVTADGQIPSLNRTVYNRAGIRIVMTQTATVGAWDFQALLINLTVSLGILSLASFIVDSVALNCCPMKDVYRQYKVRQSVSLSELKDLGDAKYTLLRRFSREPYLVDPIPDVLAQAITDKRARELERAEMIAQLEHGQHGPTHHLSPAARYATTNAALMAGHPSIGTGGNSNQVSPSVQQQSRAPTHVASVDADAPQLRVFSANPRSIHAQQQVHNPLSAAAEGMTSPGSREGALVPSPGTTANGIGAVGGGGGPIGVSVTAGPRRVSSVIHAAVAATLSTTQRRSIAPRADAPQVLVTASRARQV